MSLSKTLYSLKVLVKPRKRWLRPDMTEKLLTWTLNINTNKKLSDVCLSERGIVYYTVSIIGSRAFGTYMYKEMYKENV